MSDRLRLELDSNLEALAEIERQVETFADQQGWPGDLLFHVQLGLEELAVNIINHGYGESGHTFQIDILSRPDALTIELVDEAKPFDPLKDAPKPDVDAELEDRSVGGVGVHLVRELMDESTYTWQDGRNRLTLVKKR